MTAMLLTISDLRHRLAEAMLTPTGDMALCIEQYDGGEFFILYHPEMIDPKKLDEIPQEAIIASIQSDYTGEIHGPVAVKGYGPFMYELVMETMETMPDGIYPDRDPVSPSAMQVWKRFMSRDDIIKVPIELALRVDDDQMNPKNYRFIAKQKKINVQGLINNNKRVEKACAELGEGQLSQRLLDVAYNVYQQRMKDPR